MNPTYSSARSELLLPLRQAPLPASNPIHPTVRRREVDEHGEVVAVEIRPGAHNEEPTLAGNEIARSNFEARVSMQQNEIPKGREILLDSFPDSLPGLRNAQKAFAERFVERELLANFDINKPVDFLLGLANRSKLLTDRTFANVLYAFSENATLCKELAKRMPKATAIDIKNIFFAIRNSASSPVQPDLGPLVDLSRGICSPRTGSGKFIVRLVEILKNSNFTLPAQSD